MNYYRRYIGDYQRDTMDLSLLEHGAYTMLLDSYYAQDGKLPETQRVLCNLCRATTDEERAAVEKVSQAFFPVTEPGVRHNARADRELATATARITAARANGARGGRPAKPSGLSVGLADSKRKITQDVTSPTTNPQPTTTTTPKTSARLNGERQELETRFAKFWQAYPRKVAKVAALRAWMKLTPGDAQLEDMLADVLDRCRSPDWLKDNGAYIPHPATYLNGKRWEDCVTDLKGKP